MNAPDADPVVGAHALLDRLIVLISNCPLDDLWPGYRVSPESKRDCAQAVTYLAEAARLIERVNQIEEPRYEAFSATFDLQERRRWAAKRGEPDPVN